MFQDAQAEMVSRQLSINVVDVLLGVELLIVITKWRLNDVKHNVGVFGVIVEIR